MPHYADFSSQSTLLSRVNQLPEKRVLAPDRGPLITAAAQAGVQAWCL